jgi:hypothetical protein
MADGAGPPQECPPAERVQAGKGVPVFGPKTRHRPARRLDLIYRHQVPARRVLPPWETLFASQPARHAGRTMVGLLAAAYGRACEAALTKEAQRVGDAGELPAVITVSRTRRSWELAGGAVPLSTRETGDCRTPSAAHCCTLAEAYLLPGRTLAWICSQKKAATMF